MTAPVGDPLRIFVGTSPDQRLAFHVLEHSLRRRAKRTLDVRPIDGRGMPVPRDAKNRARTAFSFARFDIPRRCGHQGTALYLDADMIALRDPAELWALPFDGATVLHADPADGAGARFSVMRLDCARLDWSAESVVRGLDEGRYSYEELLRELCIVPAERRRAAIPACWNALDLFVPGETALMHYTSVPTQPWVRPGHPHGAPWYRELIDALASGAVSRSLIDEEVERGHVGRQVLAWARSALGVRGAT